jgi:hypothetical protein
MGMLALPSPLNDTPRASAAIRLITTSGTYALDRIEIGMAAVINSTMPPALSSFDVQVTYDGVTTRNLVTRFEVSNLTNIHLFLTSAVYIGATITVSYTAPGNVNDLSNNALQRSDGVDFDTFLNLPVTNASGQFRPQPNTPGTPTVVAGGESATITVTRPTGGLTPTSYEVTASPGGATCTVTGASGSCVISGLTAGVAYTFTTVAMRSGLGSPASDASPAVTVLAKTAAPTTGDVADTTAPPATGGSNAPSWGTEPLTDSETDAFTEGIWPAVIPGNIIITSEFGFTVAKNNRIKPKIRMKNYAGKITKMTLSARYKDGSKTKRYKCVYASFGSTRKVKTAKWKWYTPRKACVLPAPLVDSIQKGTATLSAKGKWSRQWVTSAKKTRPDKTKIKARTLRYTVKGLPS